MVSYLYNAPAGVPGDVSRVDESNVEPSMLQSPFPASFGLAMKYTTDGNGNTGVTPFAAADAAAVVAGLLVRAVPGISQSNTDEASFVFEPNQKEPNGLMTRGYAYVKVNAGTPVRGTAVYIVQTASSGHPAGAFETTSNSGNNIALSGTIGGNWTWAADGVDENGFGEVRIAQ